MQDTRPVVRATVLGVSVAFAVVVSPLLADETAASPSNEGPAVAAAPASLPASGAGFWNRYVQRHLEIGVRFSRYRLIDDRRAGVDGYDNRNHMPSRGGVNYVGSLWGLDVKQWRWLMPYVQYRFGDYIGIGAAYDEVRAKTIDWGDDAKTFNTTDGSVEVHGPLAYVFARYPIASRFTPQIEYGMAFYDATMDVDPIWLSHPGYRFVVDDTRGRFLGIGCDVALRKGWQLNVYYRQMRDVDVGARAYFLASGADNGPVGREGAFPLDYDMYALGIACRL